MLLCRDNVDIQGDCLFVWSFVRSFLCLFVCLPVCFFLSQYVCLHSTVVKTLSSVNAMSKSGCDVSSLTHSRVIYNALVNALVNGF